jgi:hypothetical protein
LTTHTASHCATRNKGKPSRSHPSFGLTGAEQTISRSPWPALAGLGQPDAR